MQSIHKSQEDVASYKFSCKYESCCPFRDESMVGSAEDQHCAEVFAYVQIQAFYLYVYNLRVQKPHFSEALGKLCIRTCTPALIIYRDRELYLTIWSL